MDSDGPEHGKVVYCVKAAEPELETVRVSSDQYESRRAHFSPHTGSHLLPCWSDSHEIHLFTQLVRQITSSLNLPRGSLRSMSTQAKRTSSAINLLG